MVVPIGSGTMLTARTGLPSRHPGSWPALRGLDQLATRAEAVRPLTRHAAPDDRVAVLALISGPMAGQIAVDHVAAALEHAGWTRRSSRPLMTGPWRDLVSEQSCPWP